MMIFALLKLFLRIFKAIAHTIHRLNPLMAVAGFSREELDVETEKNTLKIIGRKAAEPGERTFLHRGIAARDFEQRFQLADHVKVVAASFENGLLNIELEREIPEALKPRKILITKEQWQEMQYVQGTAPSEVLQAQTEFADVNEEEPEDDES